MIGRKRCFITSTIAVTTLSVLAAACGGGGPSLTEQAARGRQTAISNGCASCHGTDGQGGSGPTWKGLAGTEVELRDGSFVVADDAYLTRSITDPDADLRPGFGVQMTENQLTDAEVADIVFYINEISQPEK